jgi:Tol biopolymer transport system component
MKRFTFPPARRAIMLSIAAGLALSACAPNTPTPPATLTSPPPAIAAAATATNAPPTPTPAPTLTPTPVPTATPRPAPRFEQITQGVCCVQPSFSPDGAQILFMDKPSRDAVTGIYAVPITAPLTAPALAFRQLGPFSTDLSLAVNLENGRTVVERIADGVKWTIPNDGRRVSFSPDAKRIAWTVGEDFGNFDVRRGDVYVANVDGSNPKLVATRYGGGLQAWMPDSSRLLIAGKSNRNEPKIKLSILNLADGKVTDVLEVERSRGITLSPDGKRGILLIAQAQNQADNGVFLLSLDGGASPAQRLNFFGAYKWCDATRLLYVPIETSAPSDALWRLDVTTLKAERLIAPSADGPFKIASGDWDVSSDDRRIVFLSARDRNIWTVTLPVACGLEP